MLSGLQSYWTHRWSYLVGATWNMSWYCSRNDTSRIWLGRLWSNLVCVGGPLTHAPMGGRNGPPSTFLPIAEKRKEISPPNFVYPSPDQFHTPWPKEFSKALIGRPLMASEWRHVLPISVKNKGARESSSRTQFSRKNRLVFNKTCRLSMAINCHLRFLIIEIFENWGT